MQDSTLSQEMQDFQRKIGRSSTPEQRQAHQEQLLLAAEALQERYSSMDFHAERAKKNPRYWHDLAMSGSLNLLPKRFIQRANEILAEPGETRKLPEILDDLRAAHIHDLLETQLQIVR